MKKEKITISNKHFLVGTEENGYVIVDTGSPKSFSPAKQITFGGRIFDVAESMMGLNINNLHEISSLVGKNVTGLIGTDLLGGFKNVIIDARNEEILFDANTDNYIKQPTRCSTFGTLGTLFGMGCYYIAECTINGTATKTILDTGACYSYCINCLSQGVTPCGEINDWHPVYGQIQSSKYNLPISVAGHSFEMPFGNLPTLGELEIRLTGAQAVVGYDFLIHYPLLIEGNTCVLLKECIR